MSQSVKVTAASGLVLLCGGALLGIYGLALGKGNALLIGILAVIGGKILSSIVKEDVESNTAERRHRELVDAVRGEQPSSTGLPKDYRFRPGD